MCEKAEIILFSMNMLIICYEHEYVCRYADSIAIKDIAYTDILSAHIIENLTAGHLCRMSV